MTVTGNFEHFQYFNFEASSLKNENLFQNTGAPFSVESTRIENAAFPYKTVLSDGNVKRIRIGSRKWTYTKNGDLPQTTLFF